MWSASFQPHMNHVSVSPTNGNGPTQGQRKTLTRVGIEPTTFGLDHWSSLVVSVNELSSCEMLWFLSQILAQILPVHDLRSEVSVNPGRHRQVKPSFVLKHWPFSQTPCSVHGSTSRKKIKSQLDMKRFSQNKTSILTYLLYYVMAAA